MRALRIVGLGVLLLALLVGTGSVVVAGPPQPPPGHEVLLGPPWGPPPAPGFPATLKRHGAFGIVNSWGDSFVLETRQGELTVEISGDTKFKVPGVPGATFANVDVGDRVAVQGPRDGNNLIAKHVLVLPRWPLFLHRVGTIHVPDKSITPPTSTPITFTITDRRGNATTFTANQETRWYLRAGQTTVEAGDWALVVAKRGPATDGLVAKAVLVDREGPPGLLRWLKGWRQEIRERIQWWRDHRGPWMP